MTTAAAPAPKRGPLFWILIALGVIVLLVVLAIGGVTYFAMNKLQELGIDAEVAREHPEYVMAKTAVGFNPDAEILEEDIDTGRIHFRSKSTGEDYVVSVSPDGQMITEKYNPADPLTPSSSGEAKAETKAVE